MKAKKETASKAIVLFPPVLSVNGLSNKYDLIVDVKWGDFSKQIKISREEGAFTNKLIGALNKALLEGSESSPYLLK